MRLLNRVTDWLRKRLYGGNSLDQSDSHISVSGNSAMTVAIAPTIDETAKSTGRTPATDDLDRFLANQDYAEKEVRANFAKYEGKIIVVDLEDADQIVRLFASRWKLHRYLRRLAVARRQEVCVYPVRSGAVAYALGR